MKKLFVICFTAVAIFALFNLDSYAYEAIDETETTEEFVMPTVDDLDGDYAEYKYLVEGTDEYNDILEEAAGEYGIDPIFLKCIMAKESCGNLKATNGSYIGAFQIGTSFGFDSELMMTDALYAARCACEVMLDKADVAESLGLEPSIYYIAKFYNGGSKYAKFVCGMYEDLSGKSSDKLAVEY